MKFAVIGNPISHSLSPLMHHANFQSLNLENTYEAINVPVNQFQDIKKIISEKIFIINKTMKLFITKFTVSRPLTITKS